MKIKKLAIISLCVALLITIFTGCNSTPTSSGNSGNTPKKQISDLTGEWKQKNSKSDKSYQAATITGDTITIYWISDNGDTKSLFLGWFFCRSNNC